MVIAVRTERGATGLEVVKVADDAAGRARLAREADVLRRAARPGVVEVVGATGSTLRLRHGGTSLARLGAIAPDHAAAIVRAVADIVDSLHQQDLVHRRIDADHVVVNDRGRPTLCGFGEAGTGDDDARADDVAALGALLDRLLDASADALWSPAHRGVRAGPRRKRALAAFRTAAAGAQRSSPGQRLTARQFATAIGDALPGLSLPTPPGGGVGHDGAGAGGADTDDPTADLGWSDLDLSMLAIDDDFDTAPADPAARTDPYARLADLAGPEPEPESTPDDGGAHGPADPPSLLGTGDEPATAGTDPAGGAGSTGDAEEAEAADGDDAATAPAPVDDDPDTPETPGSPDPVVAALGTALGPDDSNAPPPEEDPGGPATAPPDPLSIEIRAGTAGTTDDDDPPGADRRVVWLVAAVLLVVGVVAGSLVARAVDPFGAEDASAADDDPERTTTTAPDDDAPPATPPPPPPECEPVDPPGPDADGDGCPDAITLDGRVATVGGVPVELGRDGDLVSFADTDCDGVATPVLLRPDTGEVFAFDEWSLGEPVEVSPIGVVAGGEDIERGPEPCSPAVVTDADGTETEVSPG